MVEHLRHVHSTWNATIRTALGAAAAVTFVLLAFAWPTYTAKPKDMPVAVVATAQQRAALETQLKAAGGAFALREVADRSAAVDLLERRQAYGGLVLPTSGSGTTEVLTASAASGPATQMLTGAAQKMGMAQAQAAGQAKQAAASKAAQAGARAAAAQAVATTLEKVAAQAAASPAAATPSGAAQVQAAQAQAAGAKKAAATAAAQAQAAKAAVAAVPAGSVKVTDVVPLSAKDPRGTGFAIAGLPLAMGGMIGGVMISTLVVGWSRRLTAVAGYGLLGGLAMALVLHTWFGFLQGSFVMAWVVCGTAIAATAAVITGAQSLLGQPGIALGAVLTMFVGNPLSSLAMPKEWLPGAWGQIGQWFVPGAAGSLMRSESYFPRAETMQPWMALLAWILVGVLLTLVGRHKDEEVIHIDGATVPD